MSFIALILGIALVGLIVFIIEKFIPMAEPFKILIRVIAAIVVIYWLLQVGMRFVPVLK